jgi:NAD(P)-dependent dehydrogenase (short-subunit alcohol dehydrogenase family)
VRQAAVNRFGRLDILVNNAGEVLSKPFEDITPEEYDPRDGRQRPRAILDVRSRRFHT